ncbi:MAG: CHAT domain-containing protein, partial [Ardenticatenaceae bacterium]
IPEADAVTKCFGRAIQLKEKAATPQAVLQKARDERPHALHLGCHGRFNKQNPEESGLMLAGGRLTLQQIIIEMQLDECHLVALSACESWVLTQAFMSAGAPTVISSQWRVNDSATRALFEAFYAHLTNGYSSASALREATRLIRDCDGWEHPYYWAPFIVNGLAHQAMPTAQPSGCALDAIQQQVETRNRERVGEQPQMDFERLERVAHTYLNGMVSRTVRKTLTLADGNTILARLASLSQQAATVPNQRDLFALYAQIHLLAEETPVLRRQLIPKNADITQMQKDRFITKEDFNKTRGPQEADPKA